MINSESSQRSEVEYLSQLRIIKKNVIHIDDIPENIAIINLLKSEAYLGQYGKIIEFIMIYKKNKKNQENSKEAYSAYITYSNELEAALAILSINSLVIDGKIIRAIFGTTKCCGCFLNNKICPNLDECNFLHNFIIYKNIIIDNNNSFSYEEHLNLAKKIIYSSNNKINKLLIITHTIQKINKSIFPRNDFILLNEEEKEKYFNTGDIRYVKSFNPAKNDVSLNNLDNYDVPKKNLFFNYNFYNNEGRKLIRKNDFLSVSNQNLNYINNKGKSEYSISGKIFDNKKNLFSLSSTELHNIFRKSINHILVTKPLYMALNNINLEILELEYFLKDISKGGVDLYELLDGCLDSISHLL